MKDKIKIILIGLLDEYSKWNIDCDKLPEAVNALSQLFEEEIEKTHLRYEVFFGSRVDDLKEYENKQAKGFLSDLTELEEWANAFSLREVLLTTGEEERPYILLDNLLAKLQEIKAKYEKGE